VPKVGAPEILTHIFRKWRTDFHESTLAGVGRRTVQLLDREAAIKHIDSVHERAPRGIGRPAKAESFRSVIADILPASRSCCWSKCSDGLS